MVSTGPPLLFFFSRPTSVEPLFLNPVSLSSSRYIATFNFVLSVHSYRGRRVISPPGKIGPDQSINSFPLPQSFLPFLRSYVFIRHRAHARFHVRRGRNGQCDNCNRGDRKSAIVVDEPSWFDLASSSLWSYPE